MLYSHYTQSTCSIQRRHLERTLSDNSTSIANLQNEKQVIIRLTILFRSISLSTMMMVSEDHGDGSANGVYDGDGDGRCMMDADGR